MPSPTCFPAPAAPREWLGHEAFAAMPATDLHASEPWFRALGGRPDEAMVAMRLEPPTEEEGRFAGVLQLQSQRDPSLVIDAFDLWSAPEVVLERFGDAEAGLLLALRRAREGLAADRPAARPAPAHLAGPAGRGRGRADGPGRRRPRRRRRPRALAGRADGDGRAEARRVDRPRRGHVLGPLLGDPARAALGGDGRRRAAHRAGAPGPGRGPAADGPPAGPVGAGRPQGAWPGSWSGDGWRRARRWPPPWAGR